MRHTHTSESASLPHSWGFDSWPASVWPNDAKRARYLFRTAQRELLAETACSRIGRSIVFFGAGYSRFLTKRAARVPGFEIPANRERSAQVGA